MKSFAHTIVEALDEASVELGFRLQDVRARREQPYPDVEQSVSRTLAKVQSAREYLLDLIASEAGKRAVQRERPSA